ncbi:hypothetical protein B0H11DRAFT_2045387 [Mycena galericulata]|nr:hypothetical protein B0H11DRAFT_2045387 [Mycena galericulata]
MTSVDLYPPGYLDAIAQPVLIAIALAMPLFGITIAQTTYYFRWFSADRVHVKTMVTILFFMDTAHTVCIVKASRDWFLVQLFSPFVPRVLIVGMVLTYTIIFIVQCSYAVRLWLLSGKNKVVTSVVILLALGQFGGGMGQSISMFIGQSLSLAHTSRFFDISGKIELSCSLACDLVITGAMVYFLRSMGGTSGIHRTSEVVNKIIVYSISVGLFTSVGTTVNIALWLGMPQTYDFGIPHLILSKLYCNSLLAMLNARLKLRERFDCDAPIDLSNGKTITVSRN